jgi:hypothetical protein
MAWTRAKAAAGATVAGFMVAGAAACSSGPQPPTGTVQGVLEVYAGPAPAATIHVQAGQTVKISVDCSWDSGTC